MLFSGSVRNTDPVTNAIVSEILAGRYAWLIRISNNEKTASLEGLSSLGVAFVSVRCQPLLQTCDILSLPDNWDPPVGKCVENNGADTCEDVCWDINDI